MSDWNFEGVAPFGSDVPQHVVLRFLTWIARYGAHACAGITASATHFCSFARPATARSHASASMPEMRAADV
jgi:hypothetical protein